MYICECCGRQFKSKASLGVHKSWCGTNRVVKKLTEEHKWHIAQAMRGKPSPFLGKHHSDKTRKEASRAFTGANHPNYGKHHSKKHKQKLSLALFKYWAKAPDKHLRQVQKNGYGKDCYGDDRCFASLQEREYYFKLKKYFPRTTIKMGRIDFIIDRYKLAIEYHPFPINGRDINGKNHEEYYLQRRILLNEMGYADYKLIVATDLSYNAISNFSHAV